MRTILDRELRTWEGYAVPGAFGAPAPARIAFRCTSDGSMRPRRADFDGDKSHAERAVVDWPDDRLLELLEHAPEVA